MALPKAVREQMERADKLIADQKIQELQNDSFQVDPELLGKPDEKIIPDVSHIVGDDQTIQKSEHAKIIKPAPTENEVKKDNSEIETLQRYNKSLDNENRHLKSKLATIEGQHSSIVESLQSEIERLKTSTTATQHEYSNKFSDEERIAFESEGFSKELIDIWEKRGYQAPQQQTINPEIQSISQKLANIEQAHAQTAQERFEEQLSHASPNWQQINLDPAFSESLNVLAPYSQKTKLQILGEAYTAKDVRLVSQIFNEFNGNPETTKHKTLDDIAQPTHSNAPPVEIPKPKERWEPAQIQKFYTYVQKNPGKYTQEQIRSIEKAHMGFS